ncbi:reverse transcriptase domain-containing protein, partial [Tanacetum coccineum]
MRTRSQSRNSNRQQQQVNPTFVEPFNLVEPIENQPIPVVTMDDNRNMAQLLEAPIVGYEDVIVVPEITTDNFELKHGLLTLVQNKQFFGHNKEDPHAHIRYFNKITSKMKFPNVSTLLLEKKNKTQAPTPVKAVEESCVTCGGTHSYRNCPATDGNVYRDNIQEYVTQVAAANFNQGNTSYRAPIANQIRPPGSGTLPSNIITNPKVDLKGITTRSGATEPGRAVLLSGPMIPTSSFLHAKVVERETEVTKDTVPPTNNGSTKDVQPPVVQVQSQVPNSEPVVAPVSALMPNLKLSIPYPSRRNDERRREKANDQIEKFYEIFKDLSFEISLTDALILMPKFASTLKALIGNKEKLSEMARTPLNEHCSAVILNKLPEKLGDPGKFLIPCDFPRMDECLALADLGASINLMPLSVWKKLSLLELTPTCMTLELSDRSITHRSSSRRCLPKSRKVQIPGRLCELTLRVGKESVTFNLNQNLRYSSNYDEMTTNRIDVIEMACEEYSQEVLGFSNVIANGNPTPYYDPIVSTSSSTLPFED